MSRLKAKLGGRFVPGLPMAWMLVFFLLPFLLVLMISFSEPMLAMPPYAPLLSYDEAGGGFVFAAHLENYRYLFEDGYYLRSYLLSLKIAALSTLFCLLIGYPMALGIARASKRAQPVLLLFVMIPFWSSFLLRVYAWMGLLRKDGVINSILVWLGLLGEPRTMLQTEFAVYVGIVYAYLPFMILPLYAALERQDPSLREAAADLGSKPLAVFRRVTLPLSAHGVIAGCLLVFIPAVGEYVIPTMLGGPDTLTIGRVLWSEFFVIRNWPVAAAVAVVLLVVLVGPIMAFQSAQTETKGA